MFDVFKWARGVKGTKVTTIKVAGASMKLEGMPGEYTVDGYTELAKAQVEVPVVSLPKVEANGTEVRTKVQPAEMSPVITLIRQGEPEAAEGKKAKGRKAKDEAPVSERGGVDPALNGKPEEATV